MLESLLGITCTPGLSVLSYSFPAREQRIHFRYLPMGSDNTKGMSRYSDLFVFVPLKLQVEAMHPYLEGTQLQQAKRDHHGC